MEDKNEKLEELKKKKEKLIRKQEKHENDLKKDETINKLMDSVQELQNKLLFSQAEFANYKRRREEETSKMLKYSNLDLASELLPIVDGFERSFMNYDKYSDEVKKFLDGFRIMYNNLINVMNKFEIKEIDCLNKEFDHNYHQALATSHVEGVDAGIVVEVLQKGYMLKDKMIRPALVKVSE